MKSLLATIARPLPMGFTGAAFANGGPMMNGGMGGSGWMGGYGGYWLPILLPILLVIVVSLVAWIVMQKRK